MIKQMAQAYNLEKSVLQFALKTLGGRDVTLLAGMYVDFCWIICKLDYIISVFVIM